MPAKKQNVTVCLPMDIVRKAKVLAAKRSTSISGRLAEQIETLVGGDDAYERAKKQAFALLDAPLKMGGKITATRESLHERKNLR